MKKRKRLILLGCLSILGILTLAFKDNCCNCPPNPKGPFMGYAYTIGMNHLDPDHYGIVDDLPGCEFDANDMAEIAKSQGMEVITNLSSQATRGNVLANLATLATKLKSGDFLLVSYSGHGGQIPDSIVGGDESDGLDETWLLYDGQLLDDEIHAAWSKFQAGVRIFCISDSCHSGTVLKMINKDFEESPQNSIQSFESMWKERTLLKIIDRNAILSSLQNNIKIRGRVKPITRDNPNEKITAEDLTNKLVIRAISPKIMVSTYRSNKEFYDNISESTPGETQIPVKASFILMSACMDNESAMDAGFNGLLTWKLKVIWSNGTFKGNYRDFYNKIKSEVTLVKPDQNPNFDDSMGGPNEEFSKQKPFSVNFN